MNWQNWELSILSLMIWREARGEGEVGMRAVGHVAKNRANRDALSVAVIICQDAQFTSINPPKKTYDPQLDLWPNPGDLNFQLAMRIAYEIMSNLSTDPTGGATFYWNPKASTPGGWYERNIAHSPNYSLIATIGDHEFHKKA